MNLKKWMKGIAAIVCCVLLTHCSNKIPPGDYDVAEVGQVKKVISGTIVSMRPVRLHNKNAEAMASNPSVGADGNLEAGAGNNSVHQDHGFEYVIRLNSGGIISVVQAEKTILKPKQRVLVIYGANTRVVPDSGSDD